MKKPTLLVIVAEIALIATAVLYLAFRDLWISFIGISIGAVAIVLVGRMIGATRETPAEGRTVGVGTVRTVDNDESAAAGQRQVFIEVVAVSGESFIGKLAPSEGDPDVSMLRPGLVVLVAFDPDAREQLSLPDDVLAVHASWLASV
jgi:hypothetical protein